MREHLNRYEHENANRFFFESNNGCAKNQIMGVLRDFNCQTYSYAGYDLDLGEKINLCQRVTVYVNMSICARPLLSTKYSIEFCCICVNF